MDFTKWNTKEQAATNSRYLAQWLQGKSQRLREHDTRTLEQDLLHKTWLLLLPAAAAASVAVTHAILKST